MPFPSRSPELRWVLFEYFVFALRENRNTTRSNIHESYKTMALYEAVKTSAETGTIVRPDYQTP